MKYLSKIQYLHIKLLSIYKNVNIAVTCHPPVASLNRYVANLQLLWQSYLIVLLSVVRNQQILF